MIVGQRKPIDEIAEMVKDIKKLLIGGCGTCVTISFAGGSKEVAELAAALKLKAKKDGRDMEIRELTPLRQCEGEYTEPMKEDVDWADAVLSLSCGVGVQTLADTFPNARVLPGVNTMMLGSHSPDRVFLEYCGACGDCILDETGGICPIVRCSKSMLNGPCGGSAGGKCEVSKDIDCGWDLIFKKLTALERGEDWDAIKPARDWRPSWHGGPRQVKA
ncbi:MAG: methylenetetrahydrofolate reductase C-terminal domain-containing protein [Actinomycetota bacterium]